MKRFLLLLLTLALSACASFKEVSTPVEEKYGEFDARTYFLKSNELINAGRLSEAKRLLEKIIAQDATKQYEPLARVRMADIFYQRGGYEEAALEYERFLELHPYHQYASLTQYRLAMCYFKQIKKVDTGYDLITKALEEFRKLQTVYPRNPYMEETEQRIQACLSYLAEYEFYIGNFYYKKESYKAASLRYRTLLYKYPHFKNESEVLFKLGKAYANQGEQHRAVETFRTIIRKYPQSEHADEAHKIIFSLLK
jgi:outer membrane protein assembly factor BamD